jgi:putative membrane protein
MIGLLSFSHFLSWMLKRYYNLTIALLTGFMIGSLNKIWPWKKVLEWGLDRHGEKKAILEENVLPQAFEGNNQFLLALILAVIGFGLIVLLEELAGKKQAA